MAENPGLRKPEERKVMTVDEAAAELRLSRNATYAAINAGQVPSIRVGRRILVPRAAFDRMLSGETA